MTQSVISLPMAASFPQTIVCFYAVHSKSALCGIDFNSCQKDTPKMFLQGESSACKTTAGCPCQHDHLVPESVTDS